MLQLPEFQAHGCQTESWVAPVGHDERDGQHLSLRPRCTWGARAAGEPHWRAAQHRDGGGIHESARTGQSIEL